jgi:hypothetical protein
MTLLEIRQMLTAQAEGKLGKERADQLRGEIEAIADELMKLSAATTCVDDEP